MLGVAMKFKIHKTKIQTKKPHIPWRERNTGLDIYELCRKGCDRDPGRAE